MGEDTRATPEKGRSFEEEAERAGSANPVREFLYYIRYSRKWWMAPIIFSLLLIGAVLVLGGTSAAPFIYALF